MLATKQDPIDDHRLYSRITFIPLSVVANGELLESRSGINIPFNLIDISRTGMGIWTPTSAEVGAEVAVQLQNANLIVGKIVWTYQMRDDFGFRLGIEALHQDSQLEAFSKLAKIIE